MLYHSSYFSSLFLCFFHYWLVFECFWFLSSSNWSWWYWPSQTFLSQPMFKLSFMSWLKSLHSEPLCSPWMNMNRSITTQMHKVSLDSNNSVLSLNVSSSWHPLSMKDWSSSIPSDVVIELSIVHYLNFKCILINFSIAFLAWTSGSFSGLNQYLMVTHLYYY